MATRPNIVFLIADDHRGTELGHLGGQAVTPHLDALASRGVSFGQAHCQGGMHGAICVPSRSSVLTGRNIFVAAEDPTGQDFRGSHTIPAALETFPQALRAAGYRTHAVGKWHNDVESFRRSFQTGDALMFGGMSDHYHVPVQAWDSAAGIDSVQPEPPGGKRPSREDVDPATSDLDHFSTNLFTDAAIRFLESGRGDEPFLLYVAYTAPHDPRTPPPGWEIDPAAVELPPNFLPDHPFDNGDLAVRDEELAPHPRDPEVVRSHIADYYGMIAHLDDGVGRVLAALDRLGLTDDTVVIYTADHGLSVGQHGLIGKQNLYEHSQRIPLVIAGPDVPQGEVSRGLVWHGDTTATIRRLAGIDPDPAAEGAPLIGGDGTVDAPRTTHAGAYEQTQRTFRDGQYKLIDYRPAVFGGKRPASTPGSTMTQLFDLDADPWEMENLAGRPEYAEIEHRLREQLQEWQVTVGDPFRDAYAT